MVGPEVIPVLSLLWSFLADEQKTWVRDHAQKAFRLFQPGGRHSPPDITEHQVLTELLRQEGFYESFGGGRLGYLQWLMVQIVQAVQAKERGVILSDLYVPDTYFYFPHSPEPKKFEGVRLVFAPDHTVWSFVNGGTKAFPQRYEFYAIDAADGLSFEKLRRLLDEAVTEPRRTSEKDAFLHKTGLELHPLVGLHHYSKMNVFLFGPWSVDIEAEEGLALNFSPNVRLSVAKDLDHLLSFGLI